MEIESKVLDLISKLMNEELEEINPMKKEFSILKDFIHKDFLESLDQGLYNDNATIVTKINDELDKIDFFDSIPQLLGKQFVNIYSTLGELFTRLEINSDVDRLLENNNMIPVVWISDFPEKKSSIYAVTYSNRMIELSHEEMTLIDSKFEEYGIEKRKLIKFFLLKKHTIWENVCFCIWPERIFDNATFHKQLLRDSKMNVVIGNSKAEIQRKLLTIKLNRLHIMLPEGSKEEKGLLELLMDKSPKITLMTSKDLLDFLQENNIKNCNYNVSNIFYSIILDVELYYCKIIKHLKMSETTMSRDLVNLPDGNVQENVSLYRDIQKKKDKIYSNALEDYRKICNELMQKLLKYQKIRRKYFNIDNADYSYYYDTTLEQIFIKLVSIGEFKRAGECLRCIRDVGVKDIEIFEMFYEFSQGNRVEKEQIQHINKTEIISENVARMLIAMNSIIGDSIEKLVEYSEKLQMPSNSLEYYLFGKRAIAEGQYEEACEYLKKAYENGNQEAAVELINVVMKYPQKCDTSLNDLARMMIPEANYRMSCIALDEDNYEDGLVYMKIAAAKKHPKAIEAIADTLFDTVGEASYSDIKQEEVFNVINLYEYLIGINDCEEYQERVGLMYCKLGDYRRALDRLSKIQTKEAYYQCAIIYENGLGVAVNLQTAREYYKKCGNYKDASVLFVKVNELLRNKNSQQNNRNNYNEQRDVVSVERSGYCFITTAACIVLKKDRNCQELNMLRKFRDEHISDGGIGDLLISEYYRVGPLIVDKIEKDWLPNGIYRQLWNYYILPSCQKIKQKNYEEAKKIYIHMVKRMCEKYEIEVDSFISKKFDINL